MSAAAAVIVSQGQGVTLPNDAVTGTGSIGTVTELVNGTSVQKEVLVGLRGDSRTLILSGLQARAELVVTETLPSESSTTATTSTTSGSSGTLGGTASSGGSGGGPSGGFGGRSGSNCRDRTPGHDRGWHTAESGSGRLQAARENGGGAQDMRRDGARQRARWRFGDDSDDGRRLRPTPVAVQRPRTTWSFRWC
jgi:hypothetical protein